MSQQRQFTFSGDWFELAGDKDESRKTQTVFSVQVGFVLPAQVNSGELS